jgi:hypothetical protein
MQPLVSTHSDMGTIVLLNMIYMKKRKRYDIVNCMINLFISSKNWYMNGLEFHFRILGIAYIQKEHRLGEKDISF